MQLQSSDQFVIVRQLNDPNDSNTYYVRAYIRKSLDDTLLDTIDLEDKGNQRFTKVWQVVADSSGQGLYIDIETRIFTDSGYTTESDVYGRDNQPFLVMQRYNPIYGGGGGDIDYKKVRQIVKEEVDKIPKVETKPILGAIKGIVIPKAEKVDFGSIARLIEQVRMKVEAIPKPEKPEKVDFSGIYKEINRIEKMLSSLWDENKKLKEESKKEIQEFIDGLKESIKEKTFIAIDNKKESKDGKPWRKNY